MPFPLYFYQVDMSKVNVDTVKPWIAQRVTELLGIEDDVLVEFVYNQLEPRVGRQHVFSWLLETVLIDIGVKYECLLNDHVIYFGR